MLFCVLALSLNAQETALELKIDKLLEAYNSSDEPGLAIRVIKNDAILYSIGFGLSNLHSNILRYRKGQVQLELGNLPRHGQFRRGNGECFIPYTPTHLARLRGDLCRASKSPRDALGFFC